MTATAPSAIPSVGSVSVSALDAIALPRHRWYFFKEAFSPAIVTLAMADTGCAPSDTVFDPFSGSGTVPLQATIDGSRVAALEVNPFLAFVSKAKLMQCRITTLEARAADAIKSMRRGRKSPLEGFSTFSERKGLDKWLFNIEVLRGFEGGWHEAVDEAGYGSAQALVRLCLLGAAMDVCNATKDGKCLRYRSDWKDREFGRNDLIKAFEDRIKIVSEDLKTQPLPKSLRVVARGDARRRAAPKPFRLCVTSPPYLNSFDYTDVYRPELFLGKWTRDMADLRRLRLRTMRSHVQVHWSKPKTDAFGSHYAESMKALRPHEADLWDSRLPLMIQAYFEDIKSVLDQLRTKAAQDASLWIVVSTSAYAGVEIPVDLIIADIATSCRWYLREVSVLRHLDRLAGQQWSDLARKKGQGPYLRESLIILDASPRRTA